MASSRLWRHGSRKAKAVFIAGIVLVTLSFISAAFAPWLTPFSPVEPVGAVYEPPSWKHPFGTDKLGFDLFSRVLFGTRSAWIVGLISSLAALGIGLPIGLISGYFGGKLDRFLATVMDALYAFPGILLAITLLAVLGPGMSSTIVAILVVFAPQYFRITRNHVLVAREEVYIEAANALGASVPRILTRYLLPNVLPSIPPILSGNLASAILVYASLSFLGLGVTPPAPSLGYELSQAQLYLSEGAWWWAVFPGLAMVIVIAGFSLFAEGLGELIDPQMRDS